MDIKKLVRKNILDLKPYSSARDEFKGQADVFLDANENPFDTSCNRYPDPYQKTVKIALEKIKAVPTQNMLLGNGSDEVLDLIVRAFCEPEKDNIVITPPTYGMYKVIADINNVACKVALLDEDFSLNTDRILSAVDQNSKILFLCSPNNPSGNIFDEERVDFLLKTFKGIVVIDEAYIDFSAAVSWSKKLDQYPNLIVCQTLSKAWGLAGIRLGMCFASDFIISILNKIKAPYNVNILSQQTALKYLSDEKKYQEKLAILSEEKSKLKTALNGLPFIQKVYPSSANFFLIKTMDANQIYKTLTAKGIIIRNRSKQPRCENCLRITVGTPEQNGKLIKALQAIQESVIL